MTRRQLLLIGAALVAIGLGAILPSAAAADWPTYHLDNTRSGNDTSEPPLGNAIQAWATPLDQYGFGTPVVSGNTVVAATENDTIYAFNLLNGALIWARHVGTPVSGGLPCGDINPLGITGTPLIDASSGTVWAVAEEAGPSHHLVGLSLAGGAVLHDNVIDPPGQDPTVEQQRPALALANGSVYVNLGGLDGDCGNYHGYVVAASASTGQRLNQFKVGPNCTSFGGGIWGTSGPAVDSAGNIYVSTGNTCARSNPWDFGDGVLELSPSLSTLISWFFPSQWQQDNGADQDLGSGGPALVSGGRVFQVGKTGIGYLLMQGNLGGMGGSLASAQVCPNTRDAAFGGNAYDAATGIVYVPCVNGINAWRIGSNNSLTHVWGPISQAHTPPILAGGLLWATNLDSGALYGINPATGGLVTSLPLSTAGYVHFASLSASGGRLFVNDGNRLVAFVVSNARATARGIDGAPWVINGNDAAVPVFNGPWWPLLGATIGSPAVVSVPVASGQGTPYYVATGTDNNVYVRSEVTAWQPLTTFRAVCTSSPGVAAVRSGSGATFVVACRGGDGALWYATAPAPTSASVLPVVTGWLTLGGTMVDGPGVAAMAPFNSGNVDGELTFFVNGDNGIVWTRTPLTGWSPTSWHCIGHLAAAAVVDTSPSNLTTFACQGLDHAVWVAATADGASWSLQRPGGQVLDGPGIALSPTSLTVVAEGTDRQLWGNTAATSLTPGFGPWLPGGGTLTNGAVAAALVSQSANP